MDVPVEGALRRGHHRRACAPAARAASMACPHDVIGYDHVEKALPPLPPRGRARARQLHPRREGLHLVHPGLPPLPHLGARGRHAPVRPDARADEMYGITKDLLLCRASDDVRPQDRPGRRLRVGPADLGDGRGLHRLRAHVVPRGRRHVVEGDPGPRPQQGRDPRLGRQPLHVLGEHPRHEAGARRGLLEARARRHELPDLGAAGHVVTARSARPASRSCSTSASCARRRSTTPSSRSCSSRSTASTRRRW